MMVVHQILILILLNGIPENYAFSTRFRSYGTYNFCKLTYTFCISNLHNLDITYLLLLYLP